MQDLDEASMNFDLEHLEPFLQRMAAKWDGFGAAEAAAIARDVGTMAIDAEKEWSFSLRRNGQNIPLVVRVFLDDVDAPDLFLFSSAEVASEMQDDLGAFADELGQ